MTPSKSKATCWGSVFWNPNIFMEKHQTSAGGLWCRPGRHKMEQPWDPDLWLTNLEKDPFFPTKKQTPANPKHLQAWSQFWVLKIQVTCQGFRKGDLHKTWVIIQVGSMCWELQYLPWEPKTMKFEGFTPPISWVITPKNEGFAKGYLGGGFKDFLCSSLFGENDPIWLIFLKWVETTN